MGTGRVISGAAWMRTLVVRVFGSLWVMRIWLFGLLCPPFWDPRGLDLGCDDVWFGSVFTTDALLSFHSRSLFVMDDLSYHIISCHVMHLIFASMSYETGEEG